VNVGGPRHSAFVSGSFLVYQHCDENVVWMDFGSFDVVGVGDPAEDVFGVILGMAWWEDLGGGGGVGLFACGTLVYRGSWFDDFDFIRAQFA